MNADERAFRDLWISELWKLCPEWHQTRDERLDAMARNALLDRSADAYRNGPETAARGGLTWDHKGAAPPVVEHRTGPLDPPIRTKRKEGPR